MQYLLDDGSLLRCGREDEDPHFRGGGIGGRIQRLAPDGTVLWTGDDLEPNLYDTLLIALPSSFLAPGSYRITVEGLSAAGAEPAGEMEFRVLAGK